MSSSARVSIITPTWQRPDLLVGAIKTVQAQRYRPLEHVVVADGDDQIAEAIVSDTKGRRNTSKRVPTRFVKLGRNWSSVLPSSFCAAPMTVGMLVARGQYQTWLADDERMSADHVSSLVEALESAGADFAYSRVTMYRAEAPESRWTIGSDPPRCGEITNVLYRAELLTRGLYPFGAGMTSDWACIERWIAAGATWAFVDRATLTHRVDH